MQRDGILDPDENDAKNVEWITNKICELWGTGAAYEIDKNPQPHEANYLKLDCSKAKNLLELVSEVEY